MDALSILCPIDNESNVAKPKSKTQIYLESLNTRLVSLLNARDFSNPDFQIHVARDFSAYMEHTPAPYVTSREVFLRRYAMMADEYPGYSFELVTMEAQVDEQRGVAHTWYLLRIMGHPEGVVKESVTISRWEKRNGTWVNTRQDGMREVGGAGV